MSFGRRRRLPWLVFSPFSPTCGHPVCRRSARVCGRCPDCRRASRCVDSAVCAHLFDRPNRCRGSTPFAPQWVRRQQCRRTDAACAAAVGGRWRTVRVSASRVGRQRCTSSAPARSSPPLRRCRNGWRDRTADRVGQHLLDQAGRHGAGVAPHCRRWPMNRCMSSRLFRRGCPRICPGRQRHGAPIRPARRGARSRVLRGHPRRDGHHGQGPRPRCAGLRRSVRPRSGRGRASRRSGSLRHPAAGRKLTALALRESVRNSDDDGRRRPPGSRRFRGDRRRGARRRPDRAARAPAGRQGSRRHDKAMSCRHASRRRNSDAAQRLWRDRSLRGLAESATSACWTTVRFRMSTSPRPSR